MSYVFSQALQEAVYGALIADTDLAGLVGAHVYDALPVGTLPDLYVALGPETVRDSGDQCTAGAEHDFTVSVITSQAGFHDAKTAAGFVSEALDGADLSLSRGTLVGLWFRQARAARQSGGLRRIDLTFRARIDE
ncbi:MAG: DUF3168 domain-containing protein [Pelagimonas sp.]|jgi:hypothetical protein|nr:DUF3168 domain-containing protein [Pelagimonas sp.]